MTNVGYSAPAPKNQLWDLDKWDGLTPKAQRAIALTLVGVAFFAGSLGVAGAVWNGDAKPSSGSAYQTTTPTNFSVDAVSDGRNGRVFALANGAPMFPLALADLRAMNKPPVEMQQISVRLVVPDVGFWVGESDAQQIFVATSGQSAADSHSLNYGNLVTVSGTLTPVPDFDAPAIPPELGQSLLTTQNVYVAANYVKPSAS